MLRSTSIIDMSPGLGLTRGYEKRKREREREKDAG
jgi:hypothetical protein